MQQTLTIIASLIAIGSGLPYIIDTIKGKTKPNIVTWTTWSMFNGINAAAALSDGALQTAIFSGAATLVTSSIALLGLRAGLKRYTLFDGICQLLALLGIVLWQVTNQPIMAVAIILLADFAGGLPTLRHAWKAPHEETLRTFALAALASALFLVSLQQYTFVAVAFPLYMFLFDVTLTMVILLRGKNRVAVLKPNQQTVE